MQHANNSENNRQSRGQKRTKRGQIPLQYQTPRETTTDLTSCRLHATFERYSVDTKMYDTRSKHIERAKGIKT